MLLVAEFENHRAPAEFNRRLCEALSRLELDRHDAAVAVVTAFRGGRTMRRVECSSAPIAQRLKTVIAEIEPALVGAAG